MLAKFAIILILALSSAASFAQERNYGDWTVIPASDDSGDTIAGTYVEDSGEALFVRCFAKTLKCVHGLKLTNKCEEKGSHPILINSSAGSLVVTANCIGGGQVTLSPFDTTRRVIVESTGMIGFAIPLDSGAFRAVRFSLKGSAAAIGEAERRVQENSRRNQTRPGSTVL